MTYRRKGHAQHDNAERTWTRTRSTRGPPPTTRIDRYVAALDRERLGHRERSWRRSTTAVDAELDAAVAEAEASPMPEPTRR